LTEIFLLDTNILGECYRREGDPVIGRWLQSVSNATLVTTSISFGELHYGIEKMPVGARRRAFEHWISDLEISFTDRILVFDRDCAQRWGKLRADLRRLGQEKPTLDLQIAAIALHHGLPIVTRNAKDFDGLGLTVINPWTIQV